MLLPTLLWLTYIPRSTFLSLLLLIWELIWERDLLLHSVNSLVASCMCPQRWCTGTMLYHTELPGPSSQKHSWMAEKGVESQLSIGDYMSSKVYFSRGILQVFQCHVLDMAEQKRGLEMMGESIFLFSEEPKEAATYPFLSAQFWWQNFSKHLSLDVISASSNPIHSCTHSNLPSSSLTNWNDLSPLATSSKPPNHLKGQPSLFPSLASEKLG